MNNEQSSLLGSSRNNGAGRRTIDESTIISYGICSIIGIFLLCMIISAPIVIKPGELGIIVLLGAVRTAGPGLHFRIPILAQVTRMSTKTQLLEQANTIPTKEGLSVRLDTAILYRLDVPNGGNLYTNVGTNYREVLIEPEAASAIRGLTSESNAKALYTAGRNDIQESIKEELVQSLGARGIVIEDVLLKDLELPAELSKSIELKAKAEQDAIRMQFVLQKERQEADRKAIEAKGIATFQDIVSQGISPNLLKWKGIEATERLADSQNTKLVIMGNDANGLPVLLSGSDIKATSGGQE